MPSQPVNVKARLLVSLACVIFGAVALALLGTGHLLWAVVPAVVGVVFALRLRALRK